MRLTDGVALLTLNDPGQRNPIGDEEMIDALVDRLAAINADRAARVAILTGAGIAFSSGGNVKRMAEADPRRPPHQAGHAAELSAVMQAPMHTTDDHRGAATAFVEKRAPRFTGR